MIKTLNAFLVSLIILWWGFSFAEVRPFQHLDAGNPSVDELGMTPEMIDQKRRLEKRSYQERKEAKETKGFFKVEQVNQSCRGFELMNQKGQINPLYIFLPQTCDSYFKHQVKIEVICQAENELSIPTAARGKTIYWTLKGKSGSKVTNDRGVLEMVFISDKELNLGSELKLSLDKEQKSLFRLSELIELPSNICTRK